MTDEELRARVDDLRAEAVRSRGFIRGAETQLSKVIALADALAAAADSADPPTEPPPVDEPVEPPVDSDFPASALFFDKLAGIAQWRIDADADVNSWTRTYYDRPYGFFASNLGLESQAVIDAEAVYEDYFGRHNGGVPPRMMIPDFMAEMAMRTGDPKWGVLIENMANYATRFFSPDGNYISGSNSEGRIQERCLLAVMAADAIDVPNPRHDYRAVARQYMEAILATQNADGSWTPPGDAYTANDGSGQASTNFMSAAAMSALIRYAVVYGENVDAILDCVSRGADWLWANEWRPQDGAFNYYSKQTPNGGPGAAHALTLLYPEVWGWLYAATGTPKWREQGDEIFTRGVENAPGLRRETGLTKHFNQAIRGAWRYLYWRDGFDLAHILNPTEIHTP